MAFSIRLILPENLPQKNVQPLYGSKTEGFLDDHPEKPLFLVDACEILFFYGVRFEINGFFNPPMPLSTEDDLLWFLESLPGLLSFLGEKANLHYKILLYEQGTQTILNFFKSNDGESVRVECFTALKRELATKTEILSRNDFIKQILDFVEAYKEALIRYHPAVNAHDWNQYLFDFMRRWQA